jgi:phosphohistidine swiveling domain-containing protein
MVCQKGLKALARIIFGTKAETLEALQSVVKHATVLPQIRFTVAQWRVAPGLQGFHSVSDWMQQPVIVRSSGLAEDSTVASLAGHFTSVANVGGVRAIEAAVDQVIASFNGGSGEDQVFIQPMVQQVSVSGVAFTRDPSNGGQYYVINYDDQTGATDSVTGGGSNNLNTHYCAKGVAIEGQGWKKLLLLLLQELESLFQNDAIDIEFAVDGGGQLVLLQVRPLVFEESNSLSVEEHRVALEQIRNRVESLAKPHPYLHGERSVFGVMPDWNPAEIIGIRPRPLALSLYKELVTDNIWAYQRDNYGYSNLRSFPLLISFGGQPYIDVRVSFNSFIPADIEDDLARRLVDYYIQSLIDNPSHHDKVEFEIIYSCYTVDLPQRLELLKEHRFTSQDCERLADSLRTLTNNIIHGEKGLWKQDIAKLSELQRRQGIIKASELQPVEKIYWLLEDCKRYGTLPFAGLARAGFIAVQLLKSLVTVGVLTQSDYHGFLNSLETVSSGMTEDLRRLSREAFLEKYGHLRPGTYDILSPRYDEMPDRYFDWARLNKGEGRDVSTFGFSLKTLNNLEGVLKEHRLEHDVLSLFNFLKGAIEGREYGKFIFTKSLSDAMELVKDLGEEYGLSPEELSYVDFGVVRKLYSSSEPGRETLLRSIEEGRRAHRVTKAISLPPLITSALDVLDFKLPKNAPNFITQEAVVGEVVTEHSERKGLKGNVMMIPSADPGFDWIFSHDIGGFVTMYGGANSHMAIRAAELKIPAVIGAGESLYNQWAKAKILEIDCANGNVRILR